MRSPASARRMLEFLGGPKSAAGIARKLDRPTAAGELSSPGNGEDVARRADRGSDVRVASKSVSCRRSLGFHVISPGSPGARSQGGQQ